MSIYGREGSAAVADLIATLVCIYKDALRLLNRIKARCTQAYVFISADRLQEVLQRALQDIQKVETEGVSRFNDAFITGDRMLTCLATPILFGLY